LAAAPEGGAPVALEFKPMAAMTTHVATPPLATHNQRAF
jgi:hypothetical protein